jgi:hypothetical protein
MKSLTLTGRDMTAATPARKALRTISVQGDDGDARRKLTQSFDSPGATESGHVQPHHDEIELTVRRAAQRVHRMMARRGLVACRAQRRQQTAHRRLVIITNHHTRHAGLTFPSPQERDFAGD